MTPTDRTEVREMIHGILSGWQAGTVAQNDITNTVLLAIRDHLSKINGTIASHEKIITKNLPHSIAHCPQTEVIKEIHDDVVKIKTVEERKIINWGKWIQIIGIGIALLMAYFGYKNLEKKMDDQGIPFVTNSRGEFIALPDSTRIMWFPNDSLKFIIKRDK